MKRQLLKEKKVSDNVSGDLIRRVRGRRKMKKKKTSRRARVQNSSE